jgi:2-oxoglutarate dehydrogenase E2 component (dihydrolipoamide succinyltransferase)
VVTEQLFAAGATVRVGDVIGRIAAGKQAGAVLPAPAAAPAGGTAVAPVAPPVAPASPVVAVRSAEPPAAPPAHAPPTLAAAPDPVPPPGLTPSRRKALREKGQSPASTAIGWETVGAHTPAPRSSGDREEIVPMTPLRKRIAERLVEAQHSAAILTTFNEVDMSRLLDLRARFQEEFTSRHGIKLGLMSFFTKAAIAALQDFPGLNAEVRESAIVYKRHYDIGIAVGSGRGLVVPVVRDADALSFAEVERVISELAGKAKENRLTLDDIAGGTFTITNGGVYGSLMSTPLLNPPQTGILGMHNIVKRPVAVGDSIELRPMMYIALSYDHRVVDGRESVQFLVGVKRRIEDPDRLLFEL